MVALIINYNRLALLINTVDWCASHSLTPVIIDNSSNYIPLLDYYNHTPYQVLRLSKNWGHRVLWDYPVLQKLGIKERFIYTDPDLDFTGVPDDFLEVMNQGLDKYPEYSKCGFSLEINDLPDDEEGKYITAIEVDYWRRPLDDLYIDADTDTTFALYRFPIGEYGHSAIRINRPYTVHHVPWYYRDFSILSDDEQNYLRTANPKFSSGLERIKQNA